MSTHVRSSIFQIDIYISQVDTAIFQTEIAISQVDTTLLSPAFSKKSGGT